MRGENESASGDQSDADGASFEDVRIELVLPRGRDATRPTGSASVAASVPSRTKRLSVRGKLAHALIVALAVIVSLAVLALRSTLPMPPQIARLLTPEPTRTPTPGQFSTGAFEVVPLPALSGALPWLAPSPRDGATAYTCTSPRQDPPDPPVSGVISLWVTHSAGQAWSRVALPVESGTQCDVEPAWDGSHHLAVTITTDTPQQHAQICAHSHFFLSDDDGATWRPLALASLVAPVVPNSLRDDCFLVVTARHLFLDIVVNTLGPEGYGGQSIFERSDDDGQTWQRADHGLEAFHLSPLQQSPWFALPLDATGDSFVIPDTTVTGFGGVPASFWVTHDAGAHWQTVTSENWPFPPGEPTIALLTEPAVADASRACHCVFLVNSSYTANFNQRLTSSRDLVHWTPLPPLPVKGASAQFSGVYATLGMTGDGRLLALGPDPDTGVPAHFDVQGFFDKAPPALWLWDTHTGRWTVARQTRPCQIPQICEDLPYDNVSVSVSAGAPGQPPGTWFWMGVAGAGRGFRVFIPAA
jgi:hypothetical protein